MQKWTYFPSSNYQNQSEACDRNLPHRIGDNSVSSLIMGTHLLRGEGNGTPLQYSCLENLMDGGAWWAAVPGVAKSQTRLSNFTFTFHFHTLEKEMATHSSALAWRIPGMEEPDGLPSMGSHRVGHDWRDLAAAAENLLRFTDVGVKDTCIFYSSIEELAFCRPLKWLLCPCCQRFLVESEKKT